MDNQNVATPIEETKPVEPVTPVEPKQPEQPKQTEKPNPEIEKLKAALNKACSEASEYKKALREKQSEAERAEAERAEADKAMREELETLRKEKAVTEYTNKCLALEFDSELAEQTANALADGNIESLFDCLKSFVDATKTRLTNEALNKQPTLSTGIPPTTASTNDAEFEQMRRWAGLPPRK